MTYIYTLKLTKRKYTTSGKILDKQSKTPMIEINFRGISDVAEADLAQIIDIVSTFVI